jgi:hypothetical protein
MGSHDLAALVSGLAKRAGDGADPSCIADALAASLQDIDAALRPIVGAGGVAALGARSLAVASSQHPWLARDDAAGAPMAIDLAALRQVAAQQRSAEAAVAGAAFLHAAWAPAPNAAPHQDRMP